MTKLSMSEEEMLKRKYTKPYEKRIAELEEKISILLSCKNCSENKGGYICEKEYENKCLAQKIQYIKELQEENAELKSRDCWKSCEYANSKAELIGQHIKDVQNLTKAKELLKKLKALFSFPIVTEDDIKRQDEILTEAEQFLKDN